MESMNFTIAGQVLDRATGRPEPDARVEFARWDPETYRLDLPVAEAPTTEQGNFFLSLSDEEYRAAFATDQPVYVQVSAFRESQQIGIGGTALGPDARHAYVTVHTGGSTGDDRDETNITIEDASLDLGTFNPPAGGPGYTASPEQLVSEALSQVVGARWTPDATPARTWELVDRAFTAEQREGATEYVWNRQYSVQPGGDAPLTGAQAVLLDRVNQSVTEMQGILRSLQPATTAAFDMEEGEAVRSLLTTLLSQLLSEIGMVPPRQPKIEILLDSVDSELTRMEDVFLFSRPFVTVEQASKATDFDKLSSLAGQLRSAWVTYLEAADEPENFGTELVLVWRDLAAVTEMVQDSRAALASVLVSPGEQQTIYIPESAGERGVSLAGLLDWAGGLEAYARTLLGEGGLRGAAVLLPDVQALKDLLEQFLDELESQADEHPGLKRPRVRRALAELDGNLDVVIRSLTRLQAGAAAAGAGRRGPEWRGAPYTDQDWRRAGRPAGRPSRSYPQEPAAEGELGGEVEGEPRAEVAAEPAPSAPPEAPESGAEEGEAEPPSDSAEGGDAAGDRGDQKAPRRRGRGNRGKGASGQ